MPDAKTYPIHPACAKWPPASAAEFNALIVDIRDKGLINPIWLTIEGEILEGKIRYAACVKAGVEPRFQTYTGNDPIGFTISQNKHRRHLTRTELAFIGEELAKLQHGTNRYQEKVDRLASRSTSETASQAKIASQLGIDPRAIRDARTIKNHGEPNVIEFAKKGEIGLQGAACFARHTSREEQRIADRKTIKKRGDALRTPIKKGFIASKRKPSTSKEKPIVGKRVHAKFKPPPELTFSLEQVKWLKQRLGSLIKRLRFQSKQHIAQFCPSELEHIAWEMEKFLETWPDTGEDAPVSKVSN